MITGKELLSSLLKTAQLGQLDSRGVLDATMEPELRNTLLQILREYDAIESEGLRIAFQRGWEPEVLSPAVRLMARKRLRIQIVGRPADSRIAGMMIREATKGMIRVLRSVHLFSDRDNRVRILAQRLLDCERAIIRQMQDFL